jgi:hypothetical protein
MKILLLIFILSSCASSSYGKKEFCKNNKLKKEECDLKWKVYQSQIEIIRKQERPLFYRDHR